MSDTVISPEEAAEIKESAATLEAVRAWRADLHANVPAAIKWANDPPRSQPGEIVFNIRDNGQVWTYTFI